MAGALFLWKKSRFRVTLTIYAKSVTKIKMSGYPMVALFILEVDDYESLRRRH